MAVSNSVNFELDVAEYIEEAVRLRGTNGLRLKISQTFFKLNAG